MASAGLPRYPPKSRNPNHRRARSPSPFAGRIQEAKEALASKQNASQKQHLHDSASSLDLADVAGHDAKDQNDSQQTLGSRIEEAKNAIKAEKKRSKQRHERALATPPRVRKDEEPPSKPGRKTQSRRSSFGSNLSAIGDHVKMAKDNGLSAIGDHLKMAKDKLEHSIVQKARSNSVSSRMSQSSARSDGRFLNGSASDLEPEMDMRRQAMESPLRGQHRRSRSTSKDRKQMPGRKDRHSRDPFRRAGSFAESNRRSMSPGFRNMGKRSKPPSNRKGDQTRGAQKREPNGFRRGSSAANSTERSFSPLVRSNSRGRKPPIKGKPPTSGHLPPNGKPSKISRQLPRGSDDADGRVNAGVQGRLGSIRSLVDRSQSPCRRDGGRTKGKKPPTGPRRVAAATDDADHPRDQTRKKSSNRRRLTVLTSGPKVKSPSDDDMDNVEGHKSSNTRGIKNDGPSDLGAEDVPSHNSWSSLPTTQRPRMPKVRQYFDAAIGALGISQENGLTEEELEAIHKEELRMQARAQAEEDALNELAKFKAAVRDGGFVTSGGAFCVLNKKVSALTTNADD